MKILSIVRYYYPHKGGNENQARLLNKFLMKEGIDIDVITMRYQSRLEKLISVDGIKVKRLYIPFVDITTTFFCNIRHFIQEYCYLLGIFFHILIHGKKYDIVHIHQSAWFPLPVILLRKLFHYKIVVKEATLDGLSYIHLLRLPSFVIPYIVKNVCFIALSAMIEENLRMKYHVLRSAVIYNGIDLSNIIPKKYISNKEVCNFLFLGNYDQGEIKGVDVLCDSYNNLIKSGCINTHLYIVGRGDIEQYKRQCKESLSYVTFVSESSDVSYYFNFCDVFVLPSRSEGMSNSLIEAMAYGLPIIATNVSGVSDLVSEKCGKIVNVADSIGLCNSMAFFANNISSIEKLGIASRYSIEKKCSIDKIVSYYKSLYSELVNNDAIKQNDSNLS